MALSTSPGSVAHRLLPILGWLPGYQRAWLLPDALAGVALWAVMIPEGMAYSAIVGVPPIAGLYTIVPPLIAYALKANANVAVVRTLARLGAGADTVSEGEIRRALAAGVPPQRIVFSGVGKTAAELAFALEAGVAEINVESEPELDLLARVAGETAARPAIAIRVNPEVPVELDLTGASVMVFRHAGHGRVNFVYRRPDGHIGWIDPPAVDH